MTAGELALTDFERLDVPAQDADAQLAERLRSGEIAAVGEAYDRYHERVRAFARRLVGDEASSEDLVQEVFVTLPVAMRRFRGEASVKSFLLSIAVNHSRHFVRAAARRRKGMQHLVESSTFDGHTRELGDPESLARRKELAEILQRALDELPLDQRVAFVLCEVDERPSPEVATIVGAPEATVRTRLYHARRKLRSYLEQYGATS